MRNVYSLYHLILDGKIYYVGITKNPKKRAAQHGSVSRSKTPISLFLRKCVQEQNCPELVVVREFSANEDVAMEVERNEISRLRKLNEPLLNIQCLQPQTFPVVGIDGRGKEYCCKKSEDQFSQSDYRVAIEYCRQRKQRWLAREQRLLKNAKSRFPDSHFYDVDKMIRSSGITQSGKDAIAS